MFSTPTRRTATVGSYARESHARRVRMLYRVERTRSARNRHNRGIRINWFGLAYDERKSHGRAPGSCVAATVQSRQPLVVCSPSCPILYIAVRNKVILLPVMKFAIIAAVAVLTIAVSARGAERAPVSGFHVTFAVYLRRSYVQNHLSQQKVKLG